MTRSISAPGGPRIVRLVGAVAEAEPMGGASLYELVRVGEQKLLGEVIRMTGETATIQMFEETSGLAVDEPVAPTGESLTAELGPGLLGSILDGIGRPLPLLAERIGSFLAPGVSAPTLDRTSRWAVEALRATGDEVEGGDLVARLEERPGFRHDVLLPPGVAGRIAEIRSGEFGVEEPFGSLEDGRPLTLLQRWPVRVPRPVAERLPGERPFVTGQRFFDLLFPVAEGGTVAVPGGFGTGKTVIEQSLAKFSEADIVVFIGCGERGNEIAEMLAGFSALADPHSGRPLLERTVLVANTSNMPVLAREASIHLGMTIAEYYRDMGYRVAVLADSLSRWAEALRELASRLREMPGEEGYPTDLASRLGKLYERAGRARLREGGREGVLTLVAAVSPPGGDFAEPVTQASLRVVGALWALDPALAHQRQFPAIDWETSYSLYGEGLARWFAGEVGDEWAENRRAALELLQKDRELREIAGLVGPEALEDPDRLVLESARLLRDLVLGQSAFDPADAFSPPEKTHALATLVILFHRESLAALAAGSAFEDLDLSAARAGIRAIREAWPEASRAPLDEARKQILAAAHGTGAR